MLQAFKYRSLNSYHFVISIINVSQSRNRWCKKGYLYYFFNVAKEWVFLCLGGFSAFGVLVCKFNFMRKELDDMDNVIGFFSFMVLKLVSLTKLSSNLGASVTEIARKLLTIKSPVKENDNSCILMA